MSGTTYVLTSRGRLWTCRTLHKGDSLRAHCRMERTTLMTFADAHDAWALVHRHIYRQKLLNDLNDLNGNATVSGPGSDSVSVSVSSLPLLVSPPPPSFHLSPLYGRTVRLCWQESPAWVYPPFEKMEEIITDPVIGEFDVAPCGQGEVEGWCVENEWARLDLVHSNVAKYWEAVDLPFEVCKKRLERVLRRPYYSQTEDHFDDFMSI